LLIHYSTDYVFDGAAGRPYIEADAPSPLSVYGRSKVEGEVLVRAAGGRHIILRTSWVYAENAQNFLMTVLNKAARGETLRVVSDQISAPTWAADLARLTRALLEHPEAPLGTWHAAAAGETSRYAYAAELLRLTGIDTELLPAQSQEFPGAVRPAYSALDSRALPRESGIRAIGPWKERLAAFLASVGRAKAPA
jgi:dTDP-4-dehydrorhamnose reductase